MMVGGTKSASAQVLRASRVGSVNFGLSEHQQSGLQDQADSCHPAAQPGFRATRTLPNLGSDHIYGKSIYQNYPNYIPKQKRFYLKDSTVA